MPPRLNIDLDSLMNLVEKYELLKSNNPKYKAAQWAKIHKQYNEDNNSTFALKQLSDRYQNYKTKLTKENSKRISSSKRTGRIKY